MKKTLLLFTILCSLNNYSQSDNYSKDSLRHVVSNRITERYKSELNNEYYSKQEIINEYIRENNEFQSLAKPDEYNALSIFLKKTLDPILLKKINFSNIRSSYRYKNIPSKIYNYTIRLTFRINKKNAISNFQLNTGNKDLNKEIIRILKDYPLDQLLIDESNKTGKISIQLFAKENKETIIKASTFPVINKDPIVKNCNYNKSDVNGCLHKSLSDYILSNISLTTLSKQKLRGEIQIRPRLSIDTNGKVFRVNSIAPNKIIKKEIDRILESFDQISIPAMRNNEPMPYFWDTSCLIIVEDIK